MSEVQTSNDSRGRGRPVGAGAKKFKYQGKSLTLREWSDVLKMPYHTLYQRIHVKGLEVRVAFGRARYARKGGRDTKVTLN